MQYTAESIMCGGQIKEKMEHVSKMSSNPEWMVFCLRLRAFGR